ncbi:MAG: hypothetical protein SGPRY_012807 [Prymnesium sp.]
MGENSKGGIAMRRSFHQADLAKEAAEEAKRQAKLAKKKERLAEEKAKDDEAERAAVMASECGGGAMEVERPSLSKKLKLGVRKVHGGIRKPNRMTRKTLKKMEKKRSMEM